MLIRTLFVITIASWSVTASCMRACGDAPDHVSERACWIKAAKDSEARVHAAQEVQRQHIEHWDEDQPYRARTLALFNDSANKFARYRQTQCEYQASAAAGGNGTGDMRLSCEVALDEDYLKSIQEQATWFSKPDG